MGCAIGMADALRCLELDMACHQDRIARSAANFLCGYPFSHRNNRPFCGIGRLSGLVTRHGFDYLLLAFTGVLMFALNYGLLFWGELHVSSGLAAVLQATIPAFGMLFANLMLPDEPLQLHKLLGALLALGGVGMICGRLLGFSGLMAFWGGLGIILGAASAAFSNVLLKARVVQLAPAMIAAWQMIFGAMPLLLIGFIVEGNPLKFHWSAVSIFCLFTSR
jgi:drug/metabolite transporter (DMT)-like permease